MSRRPAVIAALLLSLAGCESIIGVDFTSYKKSSCSPLASSSCPSGQSCLFDTNKTEFACGTASGTLVQDQRCTNESDCEPGLACIKFKTNNNSHCARYCASKSDCGDGRDCFEFSVPRKITNGTIGGCGPLLTACDPLVATTQCNPGRCVLVDTDYTICVPQEGTLDVGAACDTISQCNPGLSCIGTQANGYVCTALCEIGGSCSSGTCIPFNPSLSIAGKQYGYCN